MAAANTGSGVTHFSNVAVGVSGGDSTLTLNGVQIANGATSVTADTTLTAANSGKMYVDKKGSATTTFTLPAAAAGLRYTFVCGNASGEILVTPQTGDAIVTKADPTGASIAPAAGTGIKNTAATNIVGDHLTLVALDATTWYTVAQGGTWASQ